MYAINMNFLWWHLMYVVPPLVSRSQTTTFLLFGGGKVFFPYPTPKKSSRLAMLDYSS